MQQSPHKIAQSGTVPETAKPHHNHQIQIGSEAAMAIAAERDVKIGPEPARQRHVPARPEFRKRGGGIWKIEVERQPIAKEQCKAYGDRRIAEEIRVDLIAVQENQQPSVLRLERLIERKRHIGGHLVEIVRDVEFEKEPRQNPFRSLDERNIRKIFRPDLRHEHFGARNRARDKLWKEYDVEEDAFQIRRCTFLPGQVDQQADVVEYKK